MPVWLTRYGFSTSLRSQYASAGWLDQPAREVHRRPRGALTWQQIVISLQALLGYRLLLGGRTALSRSQRAPPLYIEGLRRRSVGRLGPCI